MKDPLKALYPQINVKDILSLEETGKEVSIYGEPEKGSPSIEDLRKNVMHRRTMDDMRKGYILLKCCE